MFDKLENLVQAMGFKRLITIGDYVNSSRIYYVTGRSLRDNFYAKKEKVE